MAIASHRFLMEDEDEFVVSVEDDDELVPVKDTTVESSKELVGVDERICSSPGIFVHVDHVLISCFNVLVVL